MRSFGLTNKSYKQNLLRVAQPSDPECVISHNSTDLHIASDQSYLLTFVTKVEGPDL